MTNRSKSYQGSLLEALADPEEAKEYLIAALEDEENPEIFLLALKDVADAKNASIELENIIVDDRDRFRIISNILNNLGFKLSIELNSI
jgi:DNA-binding phage protein